MENTTLQSIQSKLFDHILACCGEKKAIPVLCELLNLNKSSIYNRINGHTALGSTELLLLAQKFNFSLDEHLFSSNAQVRFTFPSIQQPIRSCENYLSQVLEQFSLFSAIPDLKVWFSVSDLPFFYHMHFRELALFKVFAYSRLNWQLAYTDHIQFDPESFPEKRVYDTHMLPILTHFNKIHTIEFWPNDLFRTTLKQIDYFAFSGQIKSGEIVVKLKQQLLELCEHLSKMAQHGKKWHVSSRQIDSGGTFEVYHNEVAPLNITLLAESQNMQGVFTVFDDPNFMFSTDPSLFNYSYAWLNNLKAKCIRISVDAEMNRRAYFNSLKNSLYAD